jgi:alpha-glucoside transport system substrate-binding protein
MKMKLAVSTALLAAMLVAPALAADLKYKPGEGPMTWSNFDDLKKVDLKGETLTIFGPWRGDDEVKIQAVLEYFRQATGADVKYASSENYEQQVVIDTQAGSPSNITILPQPGLLADLAAKGFLTPLAEGDAKFVNENYGAGRHIQRQRWRFSFLRIPLQGRLEVAGLVQPRKLQRRWLCHSKHDGRVDCAARQDRR